MAPCGFDGDPVWRGWCACCALRVPWLLGCAHASPSWYAPGCMQVPACDPAAERCTFGCLLTQGTSFVPTNWTLLCKVGGEGQHVALARFAWPWYRK